MRQWVASLVGLALLLTECGWQPPPPPPIPAELANLPVRMTTIGCTPDDRPLGIMMVHEYPGLPSGDNSGGEGIRGKDLFPLPYCENVTVTEVYWSPAPSTQRYFARIRLDDGREGWVSILDLGIDEP